MSTRAARIHSIQWLRAIAAAAVLFGHFAASSDRHGIHVPGLSGQRLGEWRVELFFVISGFIMIQLTRRHCGSVADTVDFWIARVLRIAPLYWLVTTFIVVLSIAWPAATRYRFEPLHALSSYLFIPSTDARGINAPVLWVAWTLNFEMYFYFAFGLLLMLPGRLRLPATLAWALVSVLAGIGLQARAPILSMLTSPFILDFAAGVCLGSLHREGWVLPNAVSLPLIVLAFAALIATDLHGPMLSRYVQYGLPVISIVAGFTSLEKSGFFDFEGVLPGRLGDMSYALYLTHAPALAVFGKLVESVQPNMRPGWLSLMAMDLLFAYFVAWLVHTFIEISLARWASGVRSARSMRAIVASTALQGQITGSEAR